MDNEFNADVLDFVDIFSSSEDSDVEDTIPKRYVRDVENPFERYTNEEFSRRYRFSKQYVRDMLIPIIRDAVVKTTNRGLPITPEFQLLLFLRFLATASFQMVCGDLFKISQSTASTIITRMAHLFSIKCDDYIRFPNRQEAVERNWELFRISGRHNNRNGIPSVDGAIDCTHIRIANTVGQVHPEAYRNRKGYFSINVQAIVDARMEFQNLVARWAGSTHDSRIFSMCTVNVKYLQGQLPGMLLGDSGYPCLRYLLTPLLNPQTPSEVLYNACHAKARNIVERAFGVWKRRFPCLSRGMGNKLTTVCNIITSCAILHNIAIRTNEPIAEEDGDQVEALEELVDEIVPNQPGEGFVVRQNIIRNHFT